MEEMVRKLEKLLAELDALAIGSNQPNILKIIHKERRENVWSDLLAYFLDPNNGGNLAPDLLEKFGVRRDFSLENVKVRREVCTNKGRIDIVVESKNFILAIENKVQSPITQDMSEYSSWVDQLAERHSVKNIYKVILSIYPHERGCCDFNLVLYDYTLDGSFTVLEWTMKKDAIDSLKYFVEERGCGIEDEILYAARNGSLKCLKYLIEERKMSVNYVSSKKKGFLLAQAAAAGKTEVCKYLVEKGADVNAKPLMAKYLVWPDEYYDSALKIATKNGHKETVEYLKSVGAKE